MMCFVAGCGGSKDDPVGVRPAGEVTSVSPRPPAINAGRAAKALAIGGIRTVDLPGLQPFGAPLIRLDWPTFANLCGTAGSELTSDNLRLARRQLVWRAGPAGFVSEERVIYRQGGVPAALGDVRSVSAACPSRIGVRPVPASAKLPGGSLLVWWKDARQRNASMETYVVPVGNQLLVVLWSNWTGTVEPPAIRDAVIRARTVLVKREQPTLEVLAH